MELNRVFEKVFVISLPHRLDRRARLARSMAAAGLSADITWIRAYIGDQMPAPAWWNAGSGAWGCLLSHARVVQEAIMDRLDNYLVLEDDVIFQPRAAEMLEDLLRDLPGDWDQLYLGGQHLREPDRIPGKRNVLGARNVNRTHAFALRHKVFARFHQHILHAPDYIAHASGWHVDHQLGIAHERGDWRVYTPLWWIAGQGENDSQISGRRNPDLWWHPAFHSRHLPFVRIPTGLTLDGGLARMIHAGNNPKHGSCEDVGLDRCVADPAELSAWLSMIAREALDMHRIPAWQHPGIDERSVTEVWRAGVDAFSRSRIEHLRNYPWNGLCAT